MGYNYKKLFAEIPDETHAAKFLQKVGILHTERFCCGIKVRPEEKKVREKLVPMWRCSSCHSRKGVRADTWILRNFHLTPLSNLFTGGLVRMLLWNFVNLNLEWTTVQLWIGQCTCARSARTPFCSIKEWLEDRI